jgi:hypothetical protein
MIEFRTYDRSPVPFDHADSVYVLHHGRIIGSLRPSADGRSAWVISGAGINSYGVGSAHNADRFGRPQCIYEAAANMILADRGSLERIAERIA